ncbi:MAG TPA: acetylxylan esterase [Fimbriiglobus sp.]|nr:acetylxylan esterase [Fimbriiglobus sp.]
MRTLAALLGAALMCPAADLPSPEKLPANPDLPDPLTTLAGKKVTTKKEWQTVRRPELKELFQHYMYGRYPAVPAKVSAKVLFEDKEAFGGKATVRELALTMSDQAPQVHVLLSLPNRRSGPAPVFVGLNFTGNHSITDHPKVRVPTEWMRNSPTVKANKATEAGRGKSQRWPLEAIAERGYAVATAYYGEIIPDDPKVRGGLSEVLMPRVRNQHQTERPPEPDDTAAVMAWAWGLHRMIDHLTTLPEIDAKRVAVVGHSRLGKAALVAAAFDDRVAVAFPSQAGCGGTGPSRSKNPKAETVQRINSSFPHWFCGHFKAFNDDTTKLPFDQHCLVAICAPRPVLFTNATEDQWANPPGQFDVLKAATPVYKLLGVEGLEAEAYPEENKLIASRLGYWVRPGKHDMTPDDWKTYLAFADRWLK